MMYGFVNAFISFNCQWTYIFIIRWIRYGSHDLTSYYYCCFFPKMTQLFRGFCLLALIDFYHHVSPLQCHFQKFAEVVMKSTLYCHSILTTPLPLRSGNAVLICIFATHSNATLVSHSNATPTPLPKYTSMPLRSAHSIASPLLPLQCHSHRTLQCHSAVSLVVICIFATHSYVTPMPLQYHPKRSEWHHSVHSGLWK